MLTLGVISDTHIPDRARRLRPDILTTFREAGVAAILHAGDVSIPSVLKKLSTLAPVYAVRGNRDVFLLRRLPHSLCLEFEGVQIALSHGHGFWWNYLYEKTLYLLGGYDPQRYQKRLLAEFPTARVIVFGHTHRSVNQWVGDQLLFNPGSPHFPDTHEIAPSLGLLHIRAGGEVQGEIITLGQATGSTFSA